MLSRRNASARVPSMSLEIYTDGSCIGNPGPGGWAYIVVHPKNNEVVYEESGSDPETTNNRMEMMALIKALEYAIEDGWTHAKVYSDSQLVVNTIMQGWKKKANTDLWLELEKLLSKVEIDLQWVKAHAKNTFNNMVDEIAFKAAERA